MTINEKAIANIDWSSTKESIQMPFCSSPDLQISPIWGPKVPIYRENLTILILQAIWEATWIALRKETYPDPIQNQEKNPGNPTQDPRLLKSNPKLPGRAKAQWRREEENIAKIGVHFAPWMMKIDRATKWEALTIPKQVTKPISTGFRISHV